VSDGIDPPADRAARGAWRWWALLVVPLGLVLEVCLYWEPVMGDGWGHRAWWHDNPLGLRPLYEFVRESYLFENPRLGQLMTLFAYTEGPYRLIAGPVLELGTLWLLTAVALGRWPRLSRSDDALAAALVTASLAACVPQLGPMLLYRPFTWNYVFGLALNLWWLVPYRFAALAALPARWWRAPGLFVLGAAAGLCNEHTGVAFAAMGALATLVAWRRGELRAWMIAGLVGLVGGYAVLLTAPAQHVRYAGLATHAGFVGRIVERGLGGNLLVPAALAGAMAPTLLLVAIGLTRRRSAAPLVARASYLAVGLGGLVCVVTLLASPKLGPRLYFASVGLIAAGIVGWLVDRLAVGPAAAEPAAAASRASRWDRWARPSCAVLAAGMLVFVAVRLVAIYRVIGPLGVVREQRIEHSAAGAAVTVPRFPVPRSRYFLGEDLTEQIVRDTRSRQFHLASLALEPPP
jgi:uncharacterized protein DUF6056